MAFQGTPSELTALAQFLSWIAATFRLPRAGKVSSSSASFQSVPSNSDSILKYSIVLQPLKDLKEEKNGTCWTPLFSSTIMAEGFPVPTYPDMFGLQVPLGAILELAEILYDVSMEDDKGEGAGLYFDGVLWKLYPTAYDADRNVVQWHLKKHSIDEIHSQALAPDHDGSPIWDRRVSLERLKTATAVLGYCNEVAIMLGTEERRQQYQRFRFTRAKIERPPLDA